MHEAAQAMGQAIPLGGVSGYGGPALNETVYEKLAGSMPAKQLMEVYAMCLNDARERIVAMRRLLAAGDIVRFVGEAHTIKGGCGLLGATELSGMAAALESEGCAAGEPAGVRRVNLLDDLAAACDRLERILGARA
jgi:HPt (histidine-containing phosphotransfer) domain-containing protein